MNFPGAAVIQAVCQSDQILFNEREILQSYSDIKAGLARPVRLLLLSIF